AFVGCWIRRRAPEREEWTRARRNEARASRVGELFRGPIRAVTLKTILVCALPLTAWWAFMFWHAQHLRNLPELASWTRPDRERLVSRAFFIVILVSIVGNFFAGWLARAIGYRRAIAAMFALGFVAMTGSFGAVHGHHALGFRWFPLRG